MKALKVYLNFFVYAHTSVFHKHILLLADLQGGF